ncbi:MAG: hypothetical protein SF028_03240 [Candidatus Sumerlaeia bacterium]|nr:hypothetical protein [Candidatus Sumerlaeia bacterium]
MIRDYSAGTLVSEASGEVCVRLAGVHSAVLFQYHLPGSSTESLRRLGPTLAWFYESGVLVGAFDGTRVVHPDSSPSHPLPFIPIIETDLRQSRGPDGSIRTAQQTERFIEESVRGQLSEVVADTPLLYDVRGRTVVSFGNGFSTFGGIRSEFEDGSGLLKRQVGYTVVTTPSGSTVEFPDHTLEIEREDGFLTSRAICRFYESPMEYLGISLDNAGDAEARRLHTLRPEFLMAQEAAVDIKGLRDIDDLPVSLSQFQALVDG